MWNAPSPTRGLLKICASAARPLLVRGDTVDDARHLPRECAFHRDRLSRSPRRDDLVRLLQAEGAVAVLDDINGLEAAIAANS